MKTTFGLTQEIPISSDLMKSLNSLKFRIRPAAKRMFGDPIGADGTLDT